MSNSKQEITGLTSQKVTELQERYGKNDIIEQKRESFLRKVIHTLGEPMFLLLIVAAFTYFILGEPRDGAVMLIFVVGVIAIDIIQEWKTDKTLHALKDLSAPQVKVIRDGVEQTILSSNLVPGDVMILYEGTKIPADGIILKCNDLCIDESTLTGEAIHVWKQSENELLTACDIENNEQTIRNEYWRSDYCYAGTLVTQGIAFVCVDKIGIATQYGKIGRDVALAPDEPTPLKKQTTSLVKLCAVIAAILFGLVSVLTYFNIPDHEFVERVIESILSGVTLAMAMIPEEFPVILAVFLSMGAWRLAKKQSLVHKLSSVETLGAISVLCVDKTGTITMNQMKVEETYAMMCDDKMLIETMGLACETDAYDPMEKAMISYCEEHNILKENLFNGEFIAEYPFTNKLKMMGHAWYWKNEFVVAIKGSPERILPLCHLSEEETLFVVNQSEQMANKGLRVIAIAHMRPETKDKIPMQITDGCYIFLGLIGLADPPRDSIKNDIITCNNAGIRVVMITGDNGITASAIANKIGMHDCDKIITGDRIDTMSDSELLEAVKSVNVFSRVIPEHKMRIVKALKENGEIVAMTGDGVNDAPALKYADIGIAMGRRGSEVSKEAADLILMDDNFTTIVETIKDGRRIYDNIRKAVGYVFSIHVPIAFASLLAPFLGIEPAALMLLPLHVVLLELIIDPTCSIVLERQPAEKDIMNRSPRNRKEPLITRNTLFKSLLQGFVIFLASFGTYYSILNVNVENAPMARAMGLAIIILSNLFLVLVNSSEHEFVIRSIGKLVKDRVMCIVVLLTVLMIAIILYTPVKEVLSLASLSMIQLLRSIGISFVSVFWYELIKLIKRWKI